ncbi:MAG: hypothetical protein HYY93_08610 [Planctomycetes bacterium]|nr:hypothetical protein [Planctomycetota bacterium]
MAAFSVLAEGFADRLWREQGTIPNILSALERESDPDMRVAIRTLLHSHQGGAGHWLSDPEIAQCLLREWIDSDRPTDVRIAASDLLGTQVLRSVPASPEDTARALPEYLVAEIVRRLSVPDDDAVRVNLLRSLAHAQTLSVGARDAVFQAALNSREGDSVRTTAIALLSYLPAGDLSLADTLRRAVAEEKSEELRSHLIEAMEPAGIGGGYAALRPHLVGIAARHPDPETRAVAISRGLDFATSEALDDVKRFLAVEPSPQARSRVLQAVGLRLVGDEPGLGARVEILNASLKADADSSVRQSAAESLNLLKNEIAADPRLKRDVLESLGVSASTDPSAAVRTIAGAVLAHLRE